MRYTDVKSSNIKAVGYDDQQQKLGVQFLNGTEYHYSDVPPSIHASLLQAKSVGKAFAANVNGRFDAKKIEKQ